MLSVRQYTVDHVDWATEAERLIGTLIQDPKPGEEKLVCTRCHSPRMIGTQIVLEAIYENPAPLVVVVPPPVPQSFQRSSASAAKTQPPQK